MTAVRADRWAVMGSEGAPVEGSRKLAEQGQLFFSGERRSENRDLYSHASRTMDGDTVLALRCECKHPFCGDVVILTLTEYAEATASLGAVVTLGHANVDGRDVIKRTSRFCIVEEARVAV
jgi:hypothetical protein